MLFGAAATTDKRKANTRRLDAVMYWQGRLIYLHLASSSRTGPPVCLLAYRCIIMFKANLCSTYCSHIHTAGVCMARLHLLHCIAFMHGIHCNA